MIVLDRLTKEYGTGARAVRVLDDVSVRVERGEIAAIVGPSGAGKSTLAQCINLLQRPTRGEVIVDGVSLTGLSGAALRSARHSIGTIFQGSSLLRRRTAAGNVSLPLEYFGVTPVQRRQRVAELLDLVGLGHKADAYPSQLSGGQQQRVGIARALALRPSVLLADEATSGLDPDSTASILGLLRELRRTLDVTIILITHEMDVVRDIADSVWRLDHGRIVESGDLGEVLTDHSSALARQLLPNRASAGAESGSTSWEVLYGAEAVPADWMIRVADELDARVGLLGASVEAHGDRLVGRTVVSFPDHLSDARVQDALTHVGLTGRPVPANSATDAGQRSA